MMGSEYKPPETRIRQVTEGRFRTRYYPEYKLVVIPWLWEEWRPARVNIGDSEWCASLEEAKQKIDKCIQWWAWCHACEVEKKARKKAGTLVSFIKYPD